MSAPASLYGTMLRLLRPFLPVLLVTTVTGALAGSATAWLLSAINAALHAPVAEVGGMMAGFAGLVALSVAGTAIAGVGNSVLGQRVIASLRKEIAAGIVAASIIAIERARTHRLLAVLNNDIDTVSAFTFNASGYVVALAITLGGFLYLLLLSPAMFLIALVALALGVGINVVAKRGWIRDYEGVRDAQDDLQKQYRAITEGAKELRLARHRRTRVLDVSLAGAADRIATLKSRAMRLYWIADATGSAVFFVVIGLLLGAQQWLQIAPATISGAVLVLLYVRGPVEQIAAGLPALAQAQISFRRIAEFSGEFPATAPDRGAPGAETLPFRRDIALRGVEYGFPGSTFTLGPIDLTLRRGETVFIVGENGSGKTTLIKLLLGLYTPDRGTVILDGTPVTATDQDSYRQLFSAVFSDYFLFDDVIVDDEAGLERSVRILKRLEIADKVRVVDGRFSTTDLSSGQRKRLALVHAWLERRPLAMFDEWAADQDPTFRRVFYEEILPELKRLGQTLIVVSHDDRYFDAADRVIRLHAGKVVSDSAPSGAAVEFAEKTLTPH